MSVRLHSLTPLAPRGARAPRLADASRPRRAVALAVVALAALVVLLTACGSPADAAWNRGEAVAQLVAEQARRDAVTRLSLRDLAPFRWERLHLVAPNASPTDTRRTLGADWPAIEAARPTNRPDAQLLVFTAGGRIVAAAALAPGAARFDASLLGRAYGPAEATFAVRRDAGEPPHLTQ